jgi:hypothetical protein
MSQVGFEPMIPVFKRAKSFYVLDRATTVIGSFLDLQTRKFRMLEVGNLKIHRHDNLKSHMNCYCETFRYRIIPLY